MRWVSGFLLLASLLETFEIKFLYENNKTCKVNTLTSSCSPCINCVAMGQEMETRQEERAQPEPVMSDACVNVKCRQGEWCNQGNCQCLESCHAEWNNYDRKLCVDGNTYRHECDMWRNQCYCRTGDNRCGAEEFNGHRGSDGAVIKYFDECRDLSGLCDWEQQEETFALRLGWWFQELLRQKWSSSSSYHDDESLLRPMGSKARSATSKLMTPSTQDSITGGVISYWFCEMDRQNKGNLDERDLSALYQVLLPSNACVEVFINRCASSGSISFDQWHNCFNIPQEDRMECSRFK